MSSKRIADLPVKNPIDAMKLPTGGFGDYAITLKNLSEWLVNKYSLATKEELSDLEIKLKAKIDEEFKNLNVYTKVETDSKIQKIKDDIDNDISKLNIRVLDNKNKLDSLGTASKYDVENLPTSSPTKTLIDTTVNTPTINAIDQRIFDLNLGSASQKNIDFFSNKRLDNSNILYQELFTNLKVTHSTNLAFMQGICTWGDYIYVARHINKTGQGNTDQCEIIQFENKDGVIKQVAVTPVLPIGHGQDLGVREKDGKIYIYASSSYDPSNISATINRCICRIEFKGASTTVSDLKYINLYSKLNRLNTRQYNTYTGSTSEDGSKYIISVAVSNSAKRDILVFNTDDLDNFDNLVTINPVNSFTQPLLSSSANNAIQGLAANSEYIAVSYGASYMSRYSLQLIDYQGNLLKELDVGALKNNIASSINNPNGTNYVSLLENEGCYVRNDKVYLAFEADVRSNGDVVSYNGVNYVTSSSSSTGTIPSTTGTGWLNTDMPVNKGEWNATTTYNAGTLVERVRAIYEISTDEKSTSTALTKQASPQSYATQYLPDSYYKISYDEGSTFRIGRWNEATREHKPSLLVDDTGKLAMYDANTDANTSARTLITTISRPLTSRYYTTYALSGASAPYFTIYGASDTSSSAASMNIFTPSGASIMKLSDASVNISRPVSISGTLNVVGDTTLDNVTSKKSTTSELVTTGFIQTSVIQQTTGTAFSVKEVLLDTTTRNRLNLSSSYMSFTPQNSGAGKGILVRADDSAEVAVRAINSVRDVGLRTTTDGRSGIYDYTASGWLCSFNLTRDISYIYSSLNINGDTYPSTTSRGIATLGKSDSYWSNTFTNTVTLQGGITVSTGSGTPEGVKDGVIGSMYIDNATGDWYQKKSAIGNLTGWSLK